MKKLIFIGGTMGVGKTATSRELLSLLPRCVFLDGDWCWYMSPFTVTEETKAMVVDNICHVLNGFLSCSEYENIVFCWVMHEQAIIDDILSRLKLEDASVSAFSLVCTEKALTDRITLDISRGVRHEGDIERSVPRLPMYDKINSVKIDVSDISAKQAAKRILEYIS